MRTLPVVLLAALAVFAGSHSTAQAQSAGYSQYGNSQFGNQAIVPTGASASGYERASGRSNPALSFYGGAKHAAYQQQSRPMLPPPLPVRTGRLSKPFSGVQQGASMSPYLGLDVRESDSSLPNYYLFVKPQLDQQRLNQVQQAQFRGLQQQVRTASAGGAVVGGGTGGGIPTTGHSAQFMNNGGFYPATR